MKFKRFAPRISGFARVNIASLAQKRRSLNENVDFAAAAVDLINLIAIFYRALAAKEGLSSKKQA
jgi:hypothetical protein